MGRAIGLDVHRDFCEVAVADGGRARSAGRVATTAAGPGALCGQSGGGRPRGA